MNWQERVKKAVLWGVVFGLLSRIMVLFEPEASITATWVWGMLLTQIFLGFLIGFLQWEKSWWIRGMTLGAGVNLIPGVIFLVSGYGLVFGLLQTVCIGTVIGLILELWIRPELRRVRSAINWGFFFGVLTWLLITAISNAIPDIGVRTLVIYGALLGFFIGIIPWEFPWWIRGPFFGAALNSLMGLLARLLHGGFFQEIGFGWNHGFWMMMVSGIIFGFCIELALRHRQASMSAADLLIS
jgi:hypothetical protein